MNYEYDDYEPYEPYEGRVLWGRIAVYVGSLVFAFVLGGCIFGGGVSQSEHEQALANIQQLSEEIAVLEQENEALEQLDRPSVDDADDDDVDPDADPDADPDDPEASQDVQVHEVVEGDSLSSIADQYYGDSSLWEPIADENGLESGNLTIGDELMIPPLAEVQPDAGDGTDTETDPDAQVDEDDELEDEPEATG